MTRDYEAEHKQVEVTYKFHLPDNKDDLWMHYNSQKMYSLLYDINDKCRTVMKYEDNVHDSRFNLAEEIRNMIGEEINLHEVC
jgi:hypothetical protein